MKFGKAARRTDPYTSHKADRKFTKSGKRLTHCQIILNCLKKHNGLTYPEIAKRCGLTQPQVWRRRIDLINNKLVYIKGEREGCGIWWVKK